MRDFKAGDIIVKIIVDEDFDRSCSDFDEPIAAECAAKLYTGEDGEIDPEYEVYGTVVMRAHCELKYCPHHEDIGSLWGSVMDNIGEPGLFPLAEINEIIPEEGAYLVTVVSDLISDNDVSLTIAERCALVGIKLATNGLGLIWNDTPLWVPSFSWPASADPTAADMMRCLLRDHDIWTDHDLYSFGEFNGLDMDDNDDRVKNTAAWTALANQCQGFESWLAGEFDNFVSLSTDL